MKRRPRVGRLSDLLFGAAQDLLHLWIGRHRGRVGGDLVLDLVHSVGGPGLAGGVSPLLSQELVHRVRQHGEQHSDQGDDGEQACLPTVDPHGKGPCQSSSLGVLEGVEAQELVHRSARRSALPRGREALLQAKLLVRHAHERAGARPARHPGDRGRGDRHWDTQEGQLEAAFAGNEPGGQEHSADPYAGAYRGMHQEACGA